MASRELVSLGTASQVPTRTRNHNAYFLRWDAVGFLFDPGEGTQRQFTLGDVSVNQVHHVCITHFHGDHCLGLSGIVQRLSLEHCRHPVMLHYPESGEVFLDRLIEASIYTPSPELELVRQPIADGDGLIQLVETDTYRLFAHRLDHGVPTVGYRLEEKPRRTVLRDRLEALGVQGAMVGELTRQGWAKVGDRTVTLEDVSVPKPGQSFALVMDTKPCEGALALAKDVDLLVMEATYTASEAAIAHEHGHSTAGDAATVAQEAGARRLAITHFSQRYKTSDTHLAEATAVFAETVALADFDRVVLR